MKRKGVSLIVLVITIIVIIIIATAIIVTLVKNNPISSAKDAVLKNDFKVAQESFVSWISARWSQNMDEGGCVYSGKITNDPSKLIIVKKTRYNHL